MTVSSFFCFYLKLKCLRMWKTFLASLPNKRLNHFSVYSLGSTTQRKSLDCEENPVLWEQENCLAPTRFPGGISSHQEPCWKWSIFPLHCFWKALGLSGSSGLPKPQQRSELRTRAAGRAGYWFSVRKVSEYTRFYK